MGKSPTVHFDDDRSHPQWAVIYGHELGELALVRHYESGSAEHWISITRADPHIMVFDELLHALQDDPCSIAYLDNVSGQTGGDLSPDYRGALFHLRAGGQHFVYRIGKYEPALNAWRASWPD